MTLRLPPLHVVLPPNAIYRRYPLPPDLMETWQILRGLAWVNKYAFTPPASIDDLLKFHYDLKRRALEYRLTRLEATGWLTVHRESGKTNVYVPIVPDDKPIDYSVKATVHGEELASVRGVSPEELARHAAAGQIACSDGDGGTSATHCMGSNIDNDVSSNQDSLIEKHQHQSTNKAPLQPENTELAELMDRTPLIEPGRSVALKLPHLTVEYLLPWVHYSEDYAREWDEKGFNGGGWMFNRFKAGDSAPSSYRKNASRREQERLQEIATSERVVQLMIEKDKELDVEIAEEEQSPPRYRQDGTADLWHATLGELQLQMTKNTFDTWVRPTHALGWDGDTDDQLVVGVHSPYAKQWLENRLSATVQRTVIGIAGHHVEIRYEVK